MTIEQRLERDLPAYLGDIAMGPYPEYIDDVLTPEEAFDLLRSRRVPVGATEEAAAHDITQDLGYHALAVDVAGAALAAHAGLTSFVEFRTDLPKSNVGKILRRELRDEAHKKRAA